MASLLIDKLLHTVVQRKASDLHIAVGQPPVLRIDGHLIRLETKVLEPEDTTSLMKSIAPERCQRELQEVGGADFGFAFGEMSRFRVSIFKQKGCVGMVLRQIPNKLLTMEQIGLPASVRAGVAALQQIDPSIEEASNILGADAQYTFRKVTLPLILPALLAGLIFSFTRHMTSLSAIIFLVSAKWRIVTASILSEWEQGGVSIAAAYSTLIIVFVMIAIALLNIVTSRLFRGREGVDLTQGL